MKKITILISVLLVIGCSTSKNSQVEVLTYHDLTKKERMKNGKVVREKYQVKKGTEIKHGKYERYDKNFLTIEQGYFRNGIKTGLWKTWNTTDEIFITKDYDNRGIESPIIEKRYLNYPIVLVEDRDTLPEGLMFMVLKFNSNCKLNKIEILNGIDNEFDEEISNRYSRYAGLCYKYDIPIEECKSKRDTLKINFKL